MKQTAVEWLIEQLHLENSQMNKPLFEQAKAMEKEQIIEALRTSEVELLSWGISAEQYYNETFKSQEQRIIDMMKGDEELGLYKTE